MRRRVTVSMKGREFVGYDVCVMYKLNPRPHVHCVGAHLNISVPASNVGRSGVLQISVRFCLGVATSSLGWYAFEGLGSILCVQVFLR